MTTPTDPVATAELELVRHVLWWAGEPITGLQPGLFEEHLLRAIAQADGVNRARLARVYPEHVALVLAFRSDPTAKLRAALRVVDADAVHA